MVPMYTGRIYLKGVCFCWRKNSPRKNIFNGWLTGSQFEAKPRKNNFVLNLEKGMQVCVLM